MKRGRAASNRRLRAGIPSSGHAPPARFVRAHFPFRLGTSTACWIPIAGTLPTRAPIWMPDVSARGYLSLAESPSVSRFIFALLFVLCSGSGLMFHSPRFRNACFVLLFSCFVFRVSCFAFRVSCFVFRVSRFVFRVSRFMFRVSCFCFCFCFMFHVSCFMFLFLFLFLFLFHVSCFCFRFRTPPHRGPRAPGLGFRFRSPRGPKAPTSRLRSCVSFGIARVLRSCSLLSLDPRSPSASSRSCCPWSTNPCAGTRRGCPSSRCGRAGSPPFCSSP